MLPLGDFPEHLVRILPGTTAMAKPIFSMNVLYAPVIPTLPIHFSYSEIMCNDHADNGCQNLLSGLEKV
jgi:hypothetical protein